MKIPKMKLRHVSMTGWISMILGILLILLGCWLRLIWLIILAIFELLAAILFLLLFNRCPHCGGFLGHAGGSGYCPHCGEKLDV